jgi:hypothetical protein
VFSLNEDAARIGFSQANQDSSIWATESRLPEIELGQDTVGTVPSDNITEGLTVEVSGMVKHQRRVVG